MQNSWRSRRKNIFITIILLFIISFLIYKSYPYLNPAPTCFDGIQNGDELGMDCGGTCSLVCLGDILPIEVKLARAVKSEEGLYDLVAIIQNKNSEKSTANGRFDYVFSIYDKAGAIIKSINASSSLLVGQTFPIILQNIPIDLSSSGNSISKVVFSVVDNKESWMRVDPAFARSFFKVEGSYFEQNKNNISQLSVSLRNLTKATFREFPVRVILSNEDGNIVAVSETIIKKADPQANFEAVFTWRMPLEVKDPKVDVYTIVNQNTDIK